MRLMIKLFTSILYTFRSVLFSGPPGIRILMYHRTEPDTGEYDQLNVPPSRFAEQMQLLSKEYNVIPLEKAIGLLKSGVDDTEGKPKVVITFDDGYLDNLTHAIPILEEHQLPATIFVTTDFCSQTATHPRYNKRKETQHMDWEQVKQLSRNPLITIGSHTLSHPLLSEVDEEQAKKEIIESKSIIEEKIEKPIHFFCYPSGNYSFREVDILDHSTFRAAVTVKPGSNSIETPMLELRRTEVTARDSCQELRKKLTGTYDLLHRALDKKRERSFKKRRQDLEATAS